MVLGKCAFRSVVIRRKSTRYHCVNQPVVTGRTNSLSRGASPRCREKLWEAHRCHGAHRSAVACFENMRSTTFRTLEDIRSTPKQEPLHGLPGQAGATLPPTQRPSQFSRIPKNVAKRINALGIDQPAASSSFRGAAELSSQDELKIRWAATLAAHREKYPEKEDAGKKNGESEKEKEKEEEKRIAEEEKAGEEKSQTADTEPPPQPPSATS